MFYSWKFLSQVTFESDFWNKTFWCVTTLSSRVVNNALKQTRRLKTGKHVTITDDRRNWCSYSRFQAVKRSAEKLQATYSTLRIKLSVWIKWQENVRFDSHGSRRTNNVAQTHCHHSDISSALRHSTVVTRVPTSKLPSAARLSKLKHDCTRQLSTLLVNSLDPCTCFPVTIKSTQVVQVEQSVQSVWPLIYIRDMLIHLLIVSVKFTEKKQQLSNCWEGRSWLKSKPELETVNK